VVVEEWPHLDGHADGLGELAAPAQRFIQVRGFHDADAADLLLAFDERPVGGDDAAALVPQHGGRVGWIQAATEDPGACRLHLAVHGIHVSHDLLQGLRRRLRAAGRVTNAEQVLFHDVVSSCP